MNKAGRKTNEREWIISALEKYEEPLVNYAFRLTRDLEQAREVVQDVFLKLCKPEHASVETFVREWLYSVCRNSALDRVRKNKSSVPFEEGVQDSSQARRYVDAPDTPSKVVELRLQTNRILELMGELTEDQQEVMRLKYQDGLSYSEISKITGHSVSNVGFLIHAGVKKTRERLRKLRQGSYGGQ